ncbi:cysteine-rich receptor-like protein kinase 10 [Phoenix dactylifera]|uniref:Cysteine-rich receptor-like protein kinase 10 n=1 Tax=Phoenix dactylifera TaxID=42345 RepID=A0A8B9A6A1_PHODC|nr:cysteine-rich receptor-like protein kinase 10 [Phoenix dactylifera]
MRDPNKSPVNALNGRNPVIPVEKMKVPIDNVKTKISTKKLAQPAIEVQKEKAPVHGKRFWEDINDITRKSSLLFDLPTIKEATNNFSSANKLGEGGFGTVYKGTLSDGQDIAVKRLSKSSGQGLEQLRNEVDFVAQLHHKNLVRVLGYCLEMQEQLLVYEYIQNKSLDTFIFDAAKSEQLNWEQRHNIIQGIARGLLYIHEDSRVRIIHRDLKASNILLDASMNPKIAYFGLARLFGGDHTESKTTKVVGTYGYMAPEYAIHGSISLKSDVFSFGVLVLEIVSGRRNNSFYDPGNVMNLLSYVSTTKFTFTFSTMIYV